MNNKGFTLVEMVVSVFMYSLIMVLFTTAVLAFTKMYELAAKVDDVGNDTEVIYKTIETAYKKADTVSLEGHKITLDGVTYWFDRTSRNFYIDDKVRLKNDDIVVMYIYPPGGVIKYYEFRIVYYKGGNLFELYFTLANF